MKKLTLIIEKAEEGFWGRVEYDDNLITEEAPSVAALEESMHKLLFDFHQVPVGSVAFEYKYDLTELFDKFKEINVTKLADRAGLNQSLLRQYVSGAKYPSLEQAKKIEMAIHQLGHDLIKVQLTENTYQS